MCSVISYNFWTSIFLDMQFAPFHLPSNGLHFMKISSKSLEPIFRKIRFSDFLRVFRGKRGLKIKISKNWKKRLEILDNSTCLPNFIKIGRAVWAVAFTTYRQTDTHTHRHTHTQTHTHRQTFCKNHFFGLRGPQNGYFH